MKAKNQSRINSAEKVRLETVVPLRTPFSVHLDICSLCNFRCNFCFQADTQAIKENHLQRGYMQWDMFEKIVGDLCAFEDKMKKIKIGLHGEPTLHPELPKMVRYIRDKDICDTLEMFTNGSLLNPELNLALVDAGLQRINISVEGLTAETYKDVTGVSLDYEKFLDNIRHLYENRKQLKIYIKIVDVGFTEEDKKTFYNTFGNICDEIFIEHIVPQWAHTNKFDLDEVGMYGQKITKYKYVCPFLFMYMHYNYDGTVSGCTLDWARRVLIGDANNDSAVEIWNGNKLKQLQITNLEKKREEIPFCGDCFAPMACCLDDLDDYCDELLNKIR